MPSSASDWDAKHQVAADAPPAEPASIVREFLPLLPRGPALDIACGTGRHTLLLAGRGQHVTAVDFSSVALSVLEGRARDSHTPVRRTNRFHLLELPRSCPEFVPESQRTPEPGSAALR